MEAARVLGVGLSLAVHAAALLALSAAHWPAPVPAAPAPAPLSLVLQAEPAVVAQPSEPPPPSAPTPAPASARPAAPKRAPHAQASPRVLAAAKAASSSASATTGAGESVDSGELSDLNYRHFYDENPKHPMRCMVGHVAQSSGDHESAVYIYQDCAQRGDNFSLLSLAVYYEVGLGGLPKDPAKAAELFHRIATGQAEAYAANGMFYYGLALYYGLGVERDVAAGLDWLARASSRGDRDAAEFLRLEAAGSAPQATAYFRK